MNEGTINLIFDRILCTPQKLIPSEIGQYEKRRRNDFARHTVRASAITELVKQVTSL